MQNKVDTLPEIFLSDRQASMAISRMVRAGTARKLSPRLYTGNMQDPPREIVRRNLWRVVALLAPGTVVSHRIAFENLPSPDGSVFISGDYTRQVGLPGLTIRKMQGSGPVEGDVSYMGSLDLASRPRAVMENLLPSRQRDRAARTVGREEVERQLTQVLRVGG